MIFIELTASVLTIATIYLLANSAFWNKYQIYGCITGLTGQAFWLYIIFAQALYGLLLADAVIFFIYVNRINKLMRGHHGR
jgi:hypothetical protein